MRTGIFGFGAPLGVLASVGLEPVDVTLCEAERGTRVDRYIERFMDPFAASVLRGLAAGVFDDLGAIVFLRESPGAMIACQYAHELTRRGEIQGTAPVPIMLNILPAAHPAADRFNRAELDRLVTELAHLGWVASPAAAGPGKRYDDLIVAQSEGRITGAAGFSARAAVACGQVVSAPVSARGGGERLALLGAPLGNGVLHAALDAIGTLALDQQALDQAHAGGGGGLDAALAAQAANPFAARQPSPLFFDAVGAALSAHRIDRVIWQVDLNDDLWGWLGPQLRDLCAGQGIRFTDLGFLPRWPVPTDIEMGAIAR